MPSVVLTDQDSGIVKAFNEAEINAEEINLVQSKEDKIRLETYPVRELNINGALRDLVELFNTKDSTSKEVENVAKLIDDVKTDVESNLKLKPKIRLWLDK